MTAPPSLETLATAERFDHQLALLREHWRSCRHLWIDTPDPLRAARLGNFTPDDIFDAGLPGLSTIKPIGADRFEFSEGGRPALIVPVYADDCLANMLDADAERHVAGLLDLVAVDLNNPGRFWCRLGSAVILGAAFYEIARQQGEPLPVYRSPLTWLKAGGAGIVVLDWDWAWDLLLDHELIAEDIELGTRLEAALAPPILVMEAA